MAVVGHCTSGKPIHKGEQGRGCGMKLVALRTADGKGSVALCPSCDKQTVEHLERQS